MANFERKYRSNLSLKEEIIKYEQMQQFRVKCKCGHSVIIANKDGKCLCSHCKNLVFRDKKTEFEYRLKQNLIKEKRKKNEV